MTQLLKTELKFKLKLKKIQNMNKNIRTQIIPDENTHLEVKQKHIIQQGYTHPV